MGSKQLDVCIIDDEAESRGKLREVLLSSGYVVREFSGARDFYANLLIKDCDAVILDMGLPHDEALSIAATLRQLQPPIGIVMMTAEDCIESRLKSLQGGADVCLTKSGDVREILAVTANLMGRLRADWERAVSPPSVQRPEEVLSEWGLSDDGWTLICPEGREVHLTAQERLFMRRILESPGVVVTRQELVLALGGDPYDYDPHRLEALVSRLRRKVGDVGFSLPLRAVRGKGYLYLV